MKWWLRATLVTLGLFVFVVAGNLYLAAKFERQSPDAERREKFEKTMRDVSSMSLGCGTGLVWMLSWMGSRRSMAASPKKEAV